MKKIFLSVVAMGLMSVSAMALDGKIGNIIVKDSGLINVVLVKDDTSLSNTLPLVGTPDAIQAMMATILTAKSLGAPVSLFTGDVNGVSGWKTVKLK